MTPAVWAPTRAHVPPPVPPAPPLPRLWIDVSNYQGALAPAWFSAWAARGYGGLIVQAVVGHDDQSYTRQQLGAALQAGWKVAGYVWCAPDDSQHPLIFDRLALFGNFKPYLEFVALDVEQPEISIDDVNYDLQAVDDYLAVKGEQPIYTGKWFFDNQGWSQQGLWMDRRLWCSDYDNIADVDHGFVPFGGWEQAWCKQFTDNPVDQNVLRV